MNPRKMWVLGALLTVLVVGPTQGAVGAESGAADAYYKAKMERVRAMQGRRVTQAQREAAADNLAAKIRKAGGKGTRIVTGPGDVPDYSGMTPNWAFSPPIRKFINSLPGAGTTSAANDLGQYIPIANADTTTYPGSDYYEIELREYTEKMHTDLPPTTLRGYVQTNYGTDGGGQNTIAPAPIHYLGPVLVAQRDKPVRIKFTNKLPTGEAGDLFLPVDETVMGAGMGPDGMAAMPMNYTQNRGTIHLHGGRSPWISDGTANQWITPENEDTDYPEGVSVQNVPDMPDPGDGSMTFFYTNQQSARFMFYHDHALGITRLNVYAGEAAGYMIQDPIEDQLVTDGVIPGPADTIPLIVQDKTFVDTSTITTTDPTWAWGSDPGTPTAGDLWMPHVYMPAQNPYDPSGMNAMGRWHYGPWFWPPTVDIAHPPVDNPYYGPANPEQPPKIPGVPDVSIAGEAFMDTAMVNGTAFPYVEVDPKSYRFRILNAADDRFFNLQMYVADETTQSSDGRDNTEVKMVPASVCATFFPEGWPTDGREGGVPHPDTAGPEWIQIAAESGFLPAPAVIPQQPVTWNLDPTTFNFGNVDLHSLLVAPAERADVVVDFSDYAGQTLILYNDAPAAFPALDARLDYYTNAPDLTDTGGHSGSKVGFGPNTRTIMQIRVSTATADPPFDLGSLEDAFASTDTTEGIFESSQEPVIIPDSRYDSAYNDSFTPDPYFRVADNVEKTFQTLSGANMTVPIEPKALQDEMGEAFDQWGRMEGKLGLELKNTMAGRQTFVLQKYIDPPTENLKFEMEALTPVQGDGTQIWRITHNGVDTHPIHVHAFDAQLINRVGWDNGVRPPDDNELGWKETFRVSPLEDTIIALRPVMPKTPFGVPNSVRLYDPVMPAGSVEGFTNIDPNTGGPLDVPVVNQLFNFGLEYMWHCHILSHEEMEMMRPTVFENPAEASGAPSLTATGTPGSDVTLDWTDPTPAGDPDTVGDQSNEVGFRVERATVGPWPTFTVGAYSEVGSALANQTSFVDTTTAAGTGYKYRVVAYNAAGDTNSNVVAIPPAPTAPSSLTYSIVRSSALRRAAARGPGPDTVTLNWNDNSGNETGFHIQRATNSSFTSNVADYTRAAGATSFQQIVAHGATYYYRVRSYTAGGPSGWSNTVTVGTIPNVPSNFRTTGRSRTSITLAWSDNSSNEQGFVIQRRIGTGAWITATTRGANTTSWTNTGLTPNRSYGYRIRAYNGIGTSDYSAIVQVSTLP